MLVVVFGVSVAGKAETYADVYSNNVALWWLSRPWKSNLVLRRFAS